MRRQTRRGSVKRLFSPLGQHLTDRLFDEVDLLVGVGAFLRELNRDEPVQIRVAQVFDLPARRAFSARRRRRFAEKRLGQPQRQSLLPDPPGALEQQSLWETASPDCIGEARPQRFVASDRGEWHCGKSSGKGPGRPDFVCQLITLQRYITTGQVLRYYNNMCNNELYEKVSTQSPISSDNC